MLRRPCAFLAYRDLHTAVMMNEGEVSKALKFMVAEVVSNAAGCFYCTTHNAENALRIGSVAPAKIKDLWLYKTSAHFSEAERAALGLAHAAGSHPPCVEDAHFDALKKHFSEDGIVEIVAVISLLGWLNRWNQTMGTALEPASLEFGEEHLATSGWARNERVCSSALSRRCAKSLHRC